MVQLLLNSMMSIHPTDFQERDPSLSFPFIEPSDTAVPTYALIIISVILPSLVMLVIQLYQRWREYENIYSSDLLTTQLGLLQSFTFARFLTDFLKNFTGSPRPNFYALCDYKEFRSNYSRYLESTRGYGEWGSVNDCLDQSAVEDACRAFPSAHAATAFAGMGFLALYLQGVSNMHKRRKIWKALIVSGPILCACMVGVDRIRNHWSTETDILCGSIIGMMCACFSFSFNFSTVSDRDRGAEKNLFGQSCTDHDHEDALFEHLSSNDDEIMSYK